MKFWQLICLLLLVTGTAYAQLEDNENPPTIPNGLVDSSKTEQGINSTNFATIKQDISTWTEISEQQTPVFNSPFPFTTDSFENDLKAIGSRTVNDKEIVDIELDIKKISLYIDENRKFINILKLDKSSVILAQKQIEATLIILKNPHNQLNLSEDELTQLLELSEQLIKLNSNIDNHIGVVEKNIEEASAILKLAKQYLAELKNQSQKQLTQANIDSIQDEKKRFQDQQMDYESKINEIKIRLTTTGQSIDLTERRLLNNELFYLQELSWLLRVDEKLVENYNKLGLMLGDQESLSNESFKNLSNGYQSIQDALSILSQQKETLQRRQTNYDNRVDKALIEYDLSAAFTERTKNLDAQIIELQTALPELSKLLVERRRASLYKINPLYQIGNFKTGLSEISKSPQFFFYQLKISLSALGQKFIEKIPVYIVLAIFTFAVFFFLNKWLKSSLLKQSESSNNKFFFQNAQKLVQYIQMGCFKYGTLVFFALLIYSTGLLSPSQEILYLFLATLAALIYWYDVINISFENKIIQRAFYLRLKVLGTLFILSVLLFLMARFSQANEFVISIYEKIVFIAAILFYLNYNKFLDFYFDKKKVDETFFQRSFRIYVCIIPWILLFCAGLGLLGFDTLAWLIAFRMAIFLTFILILFIGYGLLNDFRKILKLKAFKKFELGAFIAQDIVSPGIAIAKIIWTILTIVIFARVTSWDSSHYYLTLFKDAINHPIFEFMGIKVSVTSVVLTIVSIYLILKISRWFRSVSYRWLYSRIDDLGVRNSLSVFTQYFIVAVGFLVTLNIIGIDLTTLTVFAGALGVGIGLGLQDIAKNFISGILLLIERPLQTGDTVTINTTEGTVKRIGMRSLTLETFDSEEVIIPNASVISDAFTNWTYSNSVLRTVLYIGASYDTPPEKVMGILEKILSENSDVLDNPRSKAIVWEYADSSINYRIQFHIDMDKSDLHGTRTTLLSKVWHEFKESGIEIPYPQRDIHIKTPGNILS